jgi:hypothetical protein
MIEVLKQALDALEANDQLINGTGTNGGLIFCMDGYYSDCFDVDPINKQTDAAIAAIKEALAQPEQEPVAWELGVVNGVVTRRPVARPQRTWVGLAKEDRLCAKYMQDAPDGIDAVIDYIESKLKELNT